MCTKVPYPNRWLERRVLMKLRAAGRPVQSIHPCFENHPGCWHITSHSSRGW